MTYLKTTLITGNLDGETKSVALNGHWATESAWNYGRRRGWRGVEMHHSTADLSGKGRGSDDGSWKFDEDGTPRQVGGYADLDDSADVHALWDELEGRA